MSSPRSKPQETPLVASPFCPFSNSSKRRKLRGTTTAIPSKKSLRDGRALLFLKGLSR
eukprot:CAMPEP_0177223902 /NCGR_PEP_ID=MMETSP0367-20130122/38733_1 /TAXON_ID=447022 ORGANISM="Scrippsiella hangoei-like, Strain SHHI-4" /NCGR_SAMPLE_ID=MMETSP0367 /ASSEMBLY_ACC=CAM_ASM_000362 /LENGTH=57 /DNA_ID=CAMNT_0018673905 /DNA_START=385 /DNA_END=554 /DNA_ORIENTATION=+